MKQLKRIGKKAIGKVLLPLCNNPVGRASLASVGYACIPSYHIQEGYKKTSDIYEIPLFGRVAAKVIESERSCLHYDRLYSIFQALRNVSKLSPVVCAEVGVYKGGTSLFISQILTELCKGKWELHSFDTFEGHPAPDIHSKEDGQHRGGNFNDTSYEEVKKLLGGFPDAKIYRGRFQDRCGEIADKKFDFVHLDVDIYEPTLFSLKFFEKRLKKNAIIIVDDYGFVTCPGVKKAVDEFMSGSASFNMFHLLTGQAFLYRACGI